MTTKTISTEQRSVEKAKRRFDAYAKRVEAIRRSRLDSLPPRKRFLELRIGDLLRRMKSGE